MPSHIESERRAAGPGFTLLEILVALSIVAMVLGLLYATFFATAKAVTDVDVSAQSRRMAEACLRRLDGELRSAYAGRSAARYRPSIRAGVVSSDEPFLRFQTIRPAWERDPDTIELTEVAYRFDADTGVLTYRRRQPVGASSRSASDLEVDDQWYPLLRDVRSVSIEVLTGGRWSQEWSPRSSRLLPDGVRVTLHVGAEGQRAQELQTAAVLLCNRGFEDPSDEKREPESRTEDAADGDDRDAKRNGS